MEYVLTGLVLVLIFSSPVVLVPSGSEYVMERLGRFHRVLGPGWHLSKIPFIDRVARRYSTQPAALDLPALTGPNKEELPLTLMSGLSCRITDSETAYRAVKDVQQSLTGLAQAGIGAALRDYEFDEMLAERGRRERAQREREELS
jgi:regulator of protease activity HflC (stomatin/prohibitin superfamily)